MNFFGFVSFFEGKKSKEIWKKNASDSNIIVHRDARVDDKQKYSNVFVGCVRLIIMKFSLPFASTEI